MQNDNNSSLTPSLSVRAAPSRDGPGRLPMVDALKGLACLAIVWHHLAFYGPMSDSAHALAPNLIDALYDYGRMAVQVFLVVGGFLAAGSLAPNGVRRFDDAGRVIGRRLVRLLVTYLAALSLALMSAALVRPWMVDASVPAAPTWPQLVAHLLLLQDLVGEEALSAGAWYVAIDFQLFVVAAVLFAVCGLLRRFGDGTAASAGRASVALLTAASLLFFNRDAQWDVTAAYFFGAYGLGMLARWGSQSTQRWTVAGGMALLGGLALALDFRSRVAVALVTALGLCLLAGLPMACAAAWQRAHGLVRLGQVSYSVFLVHFPVCLLVNAVVHELWPVQPWINAAGMVLAFALSLAAGGLLYRRVEIRVPSWQRALRYEAGVLGTALCLAALAMR